MRNLPKPQANCEGVARTDNVTRDAGRHTAGIFYFALLLSTKLPLPKLQGDGLVVEGEILDDNLPFGGCRDLT